MITKFNASSKKTYLQSFSNQVRICLTGFVMRIRIRITKDLLDPDSYGRRWSESPGTSQISWKCNMLSLKTNSMCMCTVVYPFWALQRTNLFFFIYRYRYSMCLKKVWGFSTLLVGIPLETTWEPNISVQAVYEYASPSITRRGGESFFQVKKISKMVYRLHGPLDEIQCLGIAGRSHSVDHSKAHCPGHQKTFFLNSRTQSIKLRFRCRPKYRY